MGRQAARELEEFAGTIGAAELAAGLKGSLRASTCQQAIRTLRATAAFGGVAVSLPAADAHHAARLLAQSIPTYSTSASFASN
jgi:hypothetical protein